MSEARNNKKRILLIAPQPFYEDRGTPIAVRNILGVLGELGFRVDVATFPVGSELALPGVRLVRTGNPFGFGKVPVGFSFRKVVLDMCLLITVLRLGRLNHYDCVHGVEEGAALAYVCKMLFGVPMIYDMQSSLPEQMHKVRGFRRGPGRWFMLQVERWLVRLADCIVASRGLASRVWSIVPGKNVWECSFDGDGPRPRNEELARRLGVLERPAVVYTGNFASYQGLDLLMKAVPLVRSEVPEVKFLLIGGDGRELGHLERLVEQSELEDTVHLLPRVPQHEVPEYLSLADALVLPRASGENAPLKIYEYISSRKPIVATDIPAHQAVLSKKTAIMVAAEPAALADGILLSLRKTAHVRKIAGAAEVTLPRDMKIPLRETIAQAYAYVIGNRVRSAGGAI